MSRSLEEIGQEAWKSKVEKVNLEVFAFTYGSLVVQLIKDYEDYEQVNNKLEKMGYNIGIRLIDDFLARTSSTSNNVNRCETFEEAMEVMAKVAFQMFLNIQPKVAISGANSDECLLELETNPLNEFVELPPAVAEGGLWYSNVLCGVIRGALEMIQMEVKAEFVSDVLRSSDNTTLIRIKLIKILDEEVPIEED
ncbi:hypothetical protein H4219_003862 [Mycoemilia scoparia]|uniref:Trafficking protein particle complex subunit BET3 n=1 Tax=Mycoemilia scoparia TaxID=417184 RepID=A0A9W8DSB5_9FUNG|nr:hypothetical protein H4219_003862 [Mycoemilia scoparia]